MSKPRKVIAWEKREAKIPKLQLDNFYKQVGITIAEWLRSLECPDCKDQSNIDWVLRPYSDGKPKLICRHCLRTFAIKGLKFKVLHVQDESVSLQEVPKRKALTTLDTIGEKEKKQ